MGKKELIKEQRVALVIEISGSSLYVCVNKMFIPDTGSRPVPDELKC